MICNLCGQDNPSIAKFCIKCGGKMPLMTEPSASAFPQTNASPAEVFTNKIEQVKKSSKIKSLAIGLFWLALTAFAIYGAIDQNASDLNNTAIENLESGNSEDAIDQFTEAANTATEKETKVTTLMNLAYTYGSEGDNEKALRTFKDAQKYTTSGTADYYLVNAEIDYYENRPESALNNYLKANEIENSALTNNALALFYMDSDSYYPDYIDDIKALEYAKKAYAIENTEIYKQNLAISHVLNENYDQGLSLLLETNLDNFPEIGMWIGLAYAGKGDDTNAEIYLRNAIKAGVELPESLYEYLDELEASSQKLN